MYVKYWRLGREHQPHNVILPFNRSLLSEPEYLVKTSFVRLWTTVTKTFSNDVGREMDLHTSKWILIYACVPWRWLPHRNMHINKEMGNASPLFWRVGKNLGVTSRQTYQIEQTDGSSQMAQTADLVKWWFVKSKLILHQIHMNYIYLLHICWHLSNTDTRVFSVVLLARHCSNQSKAGEYSVRYLGISKFWAAKIFWTLSPCIWMGINTNSC